MIADSPLGYGRSYRRALEIAAECNARTVVVETICSDRAEWARRIDGRARSGLAAHHTTDWAGVEAFLARSAEDPFEVKELHLVVDTAGRSQATVVNEVLRRLESTSSR